MFSKQTRLKLLSFYPPFLGAGIRVSNVSEDLQTIEVRMKLRWWNRNVVGTHFGGSLYTMCDPFYMLILLEKMGKEYMIWDKAASIRFKKPSLTTVTARFQISSQQIQDIRSEVDRIGRKDYTFSTRVVGEQGEVIAEVEKLVYVRRRDFVFAAQKGDRRKGGERNAPRE
jgi:acyl-coenzyme A thioesterase PaaI-like protein